MLDLAASIEIIWTSQLCSRVKNAFHRFHLICSMANYCGIAGVVERN